MRNTILKVTKVKMVDNKYEPKNKELKKYKNFVAKQIAKLFPVFSKAAVGDFSKRLKLPGKENEFTSVFTGVNEILQVIRGNVGELKELNKKLTKKIEARTEKTTLSGKALRKELRAHKKTERALMESQGRYATLVEKGNDGIVIIQDGLLKFANTRMEKLTGFKLSDAIRKQFTKFIAPEFRSLALQIHKKRLSGKPVPKTYEVDLLTKMGKKVPVEISASLINHRGRKAIMALIRDITERHEAELDLQEEKKKLDAIYKTVKEGLALYDKDGRVLFMNPSLKKLFSVKTNLVGVAREKIVKNRRKYFKYYLERYDNSLKTQERVYSGKPVSNILMKLHSKPPKYIEANYVPIKDKEGTVVAMSASFRDVTLLKNQAEKISRQLLEVERQRNRMRAIFENVEEAVFIFDQSLKIIRTNSACELMAASSEEEMVGKYYHDVFKCHDRFGHYYPDFDPVTKVFVTGEAVPYDEHLHTSQDKKEIWVGVSYNPIFNAKGNIEQVISIVRDITAIKELEKSKSEFVSMASHELRTPLTIVNGYLSLLLNGDLGDLKNENARTNFLTVLQKVQNETTRLTKLVAELLNVSRIEEGRLRLNLRKVSVLNIINEVREEFTPIAAMKGVRLNLDSQINSKIDGFLVEVDRNRFKEILVNLIDNAIKYSGNGGDVRIGCYKSNGKVFFSVQDSGFGIPEKMRSRIFDKFQQVPGSYLKENKGTGLGLFIVKSLVELHDGKIWVDSRVGAGTTFNFYIPLVAGK
ncbi:MAG: PAS domain S-box protein [Candidatus Woykebacteria bacterium]